MLSSKEDHQCFVQLIQQSSMFSVLINKIGTRLITSEGKKSGSADLSSKIIKSGPKIQDHDSSQEIFNQSSSEEDIIEI